MLIPDPSLEVADRFRGAVLLLTIGHRFSEIKRLIFWATGSGGANLSQGDQAKVPALHYQVLSPGKYCQVFPERKIYVVLSSSIMCLCLLVGK